jgi:predicted GIY-YIG superfamily endonuclease
LNFLPHANPITSCDFATGFLITSLCNNTIGDLKFLITPTHLPRKTLHQKFAFAFFRYYFSKMWTVYILKCSDNTYYVGCTSDLNKRLVRHNRGDVKYTSTRLPLTVVHQSIFPDKYKAYDFEIYLKSGSGRAFSIKRLHSF